jgi:hypothetical protein
MGYALMLHEAAPVDPEAAKTAFAAVEGYVAADGLAQARLAHGVLVTNLTKDKARALHTELMQRGVMVELANDDWLNVPKATTCRRASVESTGLRSSDMYGVSRLIEWANLLAVSVATVPKGQIEKVKDAEIGSGMEGAVYDEAEYAFKEKDVLLLDIVSRDPVRRLQIESNSFDYAYLGSRRASSGNVNLGLLVTDIVAHASASMAMGRGVAPLLSGDKKTLRHRVKRHLDQEIAWLLWRHHGPGQALDGVLDYRREPFGDEAASDADRFVANVRQASVARVMQSNSADRDRYLERTRNLDMVLAALAGVLCGAFVVLRFGIDGAVMRVGMAAITVAITGPIAFASIRSWREKSFWFDGPR